MGARLRPAFGRTKDDLLPEESQLEAFPNDRFHYGLLGFLYKRRGGGGASLDGSSSGGGRSVSEGSSSPTRGEDGGLRVGQSAAPKSASPSASSSSWSWKKPLTPKAKSGTGGSSPSQPKIFVPDPRKLPKILKIPKMPKPKPKPKPKPEGKPPRNSLPGSAPAHPSQYGSGGHLPLVDGGGHNHDRAHPSPAPSCMNPKGIERLRCEKADAVVGTIFAIMALLLVPFLIYSCIMYCKRRKGGREVKHDEEDGIELTGGVNDYDTSPQIDRGREDDASNIDLAIGTPQESFTLANEQMQDQDPSPGSSLGRKPPPAKSVSRGRRGRGGRKLSPSIMSVTGSPSSGKIRTAMFGQAVQETNVVDVTSSMGDARRDSQRRYSSSGVDGTSDCSPLRDGKRQCSEDEGRNCAENGVEDVDRHMDAERRSRSSSRRSCSRVSEQQEEENDQPEATPSHCSSRRSSSNCPDAQPDNELNVQEDATTMQSVSRPSSIASCHE
ncbi:MAG: hypothetical protein ALECFALPRED_000646 [Alectoria fallacina]|uniref:Uncharacterized protein n=1 Tax=Alectoria fallacina TaxID=1903189 RepID=A0A8H3FA75_9LECA|nr:MAG: hypothetical protein ALECFALPRED_000646 [Alectoria fallacina]